jgi:hypothetical protein
MRGGWREPSFGLLSRPACLGYNTERLSAGFLVPLGRWRHEWLEKTAGLELIEAQVIVEQEQQLFLHQINLGEIKDVRKFFPVHILW